MDTVKIDLPSSGMKTYGNFSEGLEDVKLKSGFTIERVINKNKSFENSKINLAMINSDRYWDLLLKGDDRYLLGQTIEARRDGNLLFTGKISDFPKSNNTNVFNLEGDTLYFGFDDSPNKQVKKSDFVNIPAENDGKWGNIIYGVASDIGGSGVGILTAYRVDNNKYLAAWSHLKSLTSVFNTSGASIYGSCTLDNNADGNAYINYSSSDLEIYFNAEGMESGGSLITDPAEQLDNLNDNFGPFTIEGISAAKTIFSARGYKGALIIHDGVKWRDIFKHFAISFDSLLYQKANGNVGIKVIDWGGNENPISTVDFIEKSTFKNWPDTSNVVNEYTRNYWYHYRNGSWQRTPQDITGSTSWKAKESSIDMRYCKDGATSHDAAGRTIYFFKEPRIWYEFQIPYVKLGNIDLASVITLIPPSGYYKEEERLAQIYRIRINSNSEKIVLEGLDISDVRAEGIILLEDEDPDIYKLYDESDSRCKILI